MGDIIKFRFNGIYDLATSCSDCGSSSDAGISSQLHNKYYYPDGVEFLAEKGVIYTFLNIPEMQARIEYIRGCRQVIDGRTYYNFEEIEK